MPLKEYKAIIFELLNIMLIIEPIHYNNKLNQ